MTNTEFTAQFEQFAPQLKSFILRMTANVQDTEDIFQDAWIKAAEKLHTFRGESSLKTWVFAIASNLTIDNLRKRKRWPENVTDICREASHSDPHVVQKSIEIIQTSEYAKWEIREHIAFCFTCISKSLPLEQHLCILLKEVYDFKINEIAEILKTTVPLVKYHMHTGRAKMIDIFEGRCALINQKGTCHQCSEINGAFNPKSDTQAELMKIKMAKEAGKADKQRLFDLRMEVLKGIDPYRSGAHELQLHHLEFNRKTIEKFLEEN